MFCGDECFEEADDFYRPNAWKKSIIKKHHPILRGGVTPLLSLLRDKALVSMVFTAEALRARRAGITVYIPANAAGRDNYRRMFARYGVGIRSNGAW